MPAKGLKSVTIDEEIYELIKEALERHRKELRRARIKSISDFVEEAVLYFLHTCIEPNKAALSKFRFVKLAKEEQGNE